MPIEAILGSAANVYLMLIAAFAARTAWVAVQQDDRENLSSRVGSSVTLANLVLGLPALLGFLSLLLHESKPGAGGIMSREMGVCILFVIGLVGVLAVWFATFVMGKVGAAIARNVDAVAAAAVVFVFTSAGAPLMLVLVFAQTFFRR